MWHRCMFFGTITVAKLNLKSRVRKLPHCGSLAHPQGGKTTLKYILIALAEKYFIVFFCTLGIRVIFLLST